MPRSILVFSPGKSASKLAALGGQHGYDHTSYNPHRCAPSRWRRLVRPGTLVLEVKRASTKTSQSIGCEQGAIHKPSNLPSRVCCQYGYGLALTPSGWLQTWQLPELIFGNIRPCLWLATDSKGCGRCHLDQDSPVQRQKNARLCAETVLDPDITRQYKDLAVHWLQLAEQAERMGSLARRQSN